MGCFLACFGFKKKKKHRKPRNKCPSGEQNHGSYVPLDSDVLIKLDTTEKNISSDSDQLKEKPRESSKSKTKKKVSFNLNVKAYEPIPNEDDITSYLSDGEEETKWEFNTETTNLSSLNYEEDSISSCIQSYPPNYRYQNCRNSYDDEDEEEEFNFNDIYDTEEDEDYYSSESDEETRIQEDNEPADYQVSTDQMTSSICYTRDRSKYVNSVLNPVENLTQWKAVKAKAAPLKREKENIMLEKQDTKHTSDVFTTKNMRFSNVTSTHGVAVDASLSNWLDLTKKQNVTKNKTDLYNSD
ncbi:hypothetical protein ACJIZ3_017082 [Penstemon smallii]|uniref:Uncharacterized protein n=1 Tax=Penstemon smallii TaxID=265156 RepID=A0ABD3SVB2_9LAMI